MRIRKKVTPNTEISTASMPDIVFLLLFFFMVSATIKTNDDQLDIKTPKAQAVTQVNKKFLLKELHVGFPKDKKLGTSPRILAGERLITLNNIGPWVIEQRNSMAESYRDQMIVLIKADEQVDMGLIGDIQTELRKQNARKVLFRTLEGK